MIGVKIGKSQITFFWNRLFLSPFIIFFGWFFSGMFMQHIQMHFMHFHQSLTFCWSFASSMIPIELLIYKVVHTPQVSLLSSCSFIKLSESLPSLNITWDVGKYNCPVIRRAPFDATKAFWIFYNFLFAYKISTTVIVDIFYIIAKYFKETS